MQFVLAVVLAIALHLGFSLSPFLPWLPDDVLSDELFDLVLSTDRECTAVDAVDRVIESVAEVTAVRRSGDGWGTAFYLGDGYWATAAHVVDGARRIHIENTIVDVPNARLVGAIGLPTDVAVLHAPAMTDAEGEDVLLALAFSEFGGLGDTVLAFGYSQARTHYATVTQGIYSAGFFDYVEPDLHLMRTDAPLNRGDSGGPIVDLCGAVVGMIQEGATDTQVEGDGGGISWRSLPAVIETLLADE